MIKDKINIEIAEFLLGAKLHYEHFCPLVTQSKSHSLCHYLFLGGIIQYNTICSLTENTQFLNVILKLFLFALYLRYFKQHYIGKKSKMLQIMLVLSLALYIYICTIKCNSIGCGEANSSSIPYTGHSYQMVN